MTGYLDPSSKQMDPVREYKYHHPASILIKKKKNREFLIQFKLFY